VYEKPKISCNIGIFVGAGLNPNEMKEMETKLKVFSRYLLIISNQECPCHRETKFSII